MVSLKEEAYWAFLKNNLSKIWKKKKSQAIETYLQVTHPSWLFKYNSFSKGEILVNAVEKKIFFLSGDISPQFLNLNIKDLKHFFLTIFLMKNVFRRK